VLKSAVGNLWLTEPPRVRQLDDEELDSGDDEGRQDRATQQDNYAQEEKVDEIVQDIELGRHAIPEPGDGEV
jgi:RNA polymerase-associated protein LEO1